MKHLFLDTNVLLSFYHFTSDDLEELRKLAAVVRARGLVLLLPEQVKDEFRRNREVKLADSLARFKQQKLNLQFPQICKSYPEFTQLREAQKSFERLHAELLGKLQTDIQARELKADEVVDELFSVATILPRTPEVIEAARLRRQVGNPPGKDDLLGDAINWETVLRSAPTVDDFSFVTADSDFLSPVDSARFNEFLIEEWRALSPSPLRHYERLSEFFRENFPSITLADEAEKEVLVERLMQSGSFASTHAIVGKLLQYSDFSPTQAATIVFSAGTNTQVAWIVNDPDVKALMKRVLGLHPTSVDQEIADALRKEYGLVGDPAAEPK